MANLNFRTTALQFLAELSLRGLRHCFVNPGTDFAPLIEAIAAARLHEVAVPRLINVPHEHVALAMAHGSYLLTDLPQAVGVHHTVGTANALLGLITAARENIPILLFAGRAPLTEQGNAGSRDVVVHWGTDTFDQGGVVREYVKWDHELRTGQPVGEIIDRAIGIAMTPPRGPVYLTLPREVLLEDASADWGQSRNMGISAGPGPHALSIATLADWLAASVRPLIVTTSIGKCEAAVKELSEVADMFAIPIVQHAPRYMNLSADHKFHAGYDPAIFLDEADLVIAIDCEAPWIPRFCKPAFATRVVHIGADPLFQKIPVRGFAADLAITSDTAAALAMLKADLRGKLKNSSSVIEERRANFEARKQRKSIEAGEVEKSARADERIDYRWVSACVNDVLDDSVIVFNDYGIAHDLMKFPHSKSFFGGSISGGLGWAMAAALGAQIVAEDRIAIAVVGDGSYLFGNPTPCHFMAVTERLPIIVIVLNNSGYAAVRRAVEVVFPMGQAVQQNVVPLTRLEIPPAYEGIATACGAHAERIVARDQMLPRLQAALDIARRERRHVLLNVECVAA